MSTDGVQLPTKIRPSGVSVSGPRVTVMVDTTGAVLFVDFFSRLKDRNRHDILDQLHNAITVRQSKKGQIHRVFEESFDAKAIYSDAFLFQKLDYIHHNPVRGKWNLVDDFAEHEHSSAGYYELGKSIVYLPKHYKEL